MIMPPAPPKSMLIYGSQEFAQVVWNLCAQCGYDIVGCIDDFTQPDTNSPYRVLGPFSLVARAYPPEEYSIAIAIGYRHLRERFRIFETVRAAGYHVPNLIHPKAYLDPSVQLGTGIIIMANSTLDMFVRVGDLAVIWPGAVLNHHTTVGANVFISPNATLCGHSAVGDHSFLGASSIVIDHTSLPDGTRLKAGERAFERRAQ